MKVYLLGGLGNQLFQTAFAIKLAQERNERIFLEAGTIKGRELGIRDLKLPRQVWLSENREHSRSFHYLASRGYLPNIYTDEEALDLIARFKIPDISAESSFYGYFQTYTYFSDVKGSIRNLFSNLKLETEPTQYLAMHVRGTDYLKNGRYVELDANYYLRALKEIDGYTKVPIKVFTDDPFHANRIFTEIRKLSKENLNFDLMTSNSDPWKSFKCLANTKNLILANSTFSWWAGWLASSNGRRVIRPTNYFVGKKQPVNFYPIDWISV